MLGRESNMLKKVCLKQMKKKKENHIFLDTLYVARFTALEEETLEKGRIRLFHLSL